MNLQVSILGRPSARKHFIERRCSSVLIEGGSNTYFLKKDRILF